MNESEGVCDICGTSGLVNDACPCGGIYRDLNVGVDDTLIDDEPDAYPKKALEDDSPLEDIVAFSDLEEDPSIEENE